MNDVLTLAEVFLKRAKPAGAGLGPDWTPLGGLLRDLWDRGRACWPDIALPAPALAEYLAVHTAEDRDPGPFLRGVHAGDVYLACACAQGIPAALKAFDTAVLSQAPGFLSRLRPSPAFTDEVCQRLRERLFVTSADAAPRIAQYSGEFPLLSWVRIVALRTALNLLRGRNALGGDEAQEVEAQMLPGAGDPEQDYIKARCQKDFKEAFREAFAVLPAEQRQVVRLHFVGGLTGDKIAALLRVNRSTVVRRLASARVALLQETRRLLQQRLRLPAAELDSLIQAVRSRLDLSISAFLRDVPE